MSKKIKLPRRGCIINGEIYNSSIDIPKGGGYTVHGAEFTISINSENYKIIQKVFSIATKRKLEIEMNYTQPIGIGYNVISLTVKDAPYKDEENFFLEIEKICKINTIRDLLIKMETS